MEVLRAMRDTLTHRGPDGAGEFLAEGVGLAHRRLSIIDLAGGTQPMENEDGSLVLTFNGEIYNYLELKPDLERRGHRFRTTSDTEVILHLYEERGPACVDALNGMFAFALWDKRQRRLLLARDRLGKKPLYYQESGASLIFASELKALRQHPRVHPRVAPAALDDYLAYGYVPDDGCILEGVRKLPPGCILCWENGTARVERYWEVEFAEATGPDEATWLEELEDLLRQAIRIRLRSDVPLGVFLSGGVDSSAIAALASSESAGRVKTFSIGFDERDYDELAYARLIAERYGTDHHELIVRDHDLSVLPELVHHLDEPFADPSALPTYYVCREARKHVTVCLSGDGGDEVFAGYTRYQQAQRHGRWDCLRGIGVGKLCGVVSGLVPRAVPGRGTLERLAAQGAQRYALQVGIFSASERRELLSEDLQPTVQPDGALFAPYFTPDVERDLVTRLQHADQKTYLPDDILMKVDRMSMQNSLEVRAPLLDYRVVEFANSIPSTLKLPDGRLKGLLKKMLAPHLPAAVLGRRKMGFGIPIKHWFRGSRKRYAHELLLSSDARSRNWLDPQAVARLLRDHESGGRDLSQKVWALVALEYWCRGADV